jgi:hypothetical protein
MVILIKNGLTCLRSGWINLVWSNLRILQEYQQSGVAYYGCSGQDSVYYFWAKVSFIFCIKLVHIFLLDECRFISTFIETLNDYGCMHACMQYTLWNSMILGILPVVWPVEAGWKGSGSKQGKDVLFLNWKGMFWTVVTSRIFWYNKHLNLRYKRTSSPWHLTRPSVLFIYCRFLMKYRLQHKVVEKHQQQAQLSSPRRHVYDKYDWLIWFSFGVAAVSAAECKLVFGGYGPTWICNRILSDKADTIYIWIRILIFIRCRPM